MARSVRGLQFKVLENIAYKHGFLSFTTTKCSANSEVGLLRENDGFLRSTSHNFQISSRLSTSTPATSRNHSIPFITNFHNHNTTSNHNNNHKSITTTTTTNTTTTPSQYKLLPQQPQKLNKKSPFQLILPSHCQHHTTTATSASAGTGTVAGTGASTVGGTGASTGGGTGAGTSASTTPLTPPPHLHQNNYLNHHNLPHQQQYRGNASYAGGGGVRSGVSGVRGGGISGGISGGTLGAAVVDQSPNPKTQHREIRNQANYGEREIRSRQMAQMNYGQHEILDQMREEISIGAYGATAGGATAYGATDAEAAYEATDGETTDGHPETGSVTDVIPVRETLSPHKLAEPDLLNLFIDIRKVLKCSEKDLDTIACYYFDGQGKVIRPIITVLMARAVNQHVAQHHSLLAGQLEIAKVTEMIHTASLLHDDVLDMADTRRGKPSVTRKFGQRKSVMAGDYILSVASTMLARLGNVEVLIVLAQVLADLVQGEFMQLGSKENENERFNHYLNKTFKKTASLIAYSCQAVAILGGADEALQQVCFQYGRNVGIAFQLVDDFLDFVASTDVMGKPTSVDLKLGMATAPVLFACEKFPELNPLIIRRFSEPGDVAFAFDCVHRSNGLQHTQVLARKHCLEAIRVIDQLAPSQEKDALIAITDIVLNRIR